jgi:hypothetical protein
MIVRLSTPKGSDSRMLGPDEVNRQLGSDIALAGFSRSDSYG